MPAFQPEMSPAEIVGPVEETADPIIVHSLTMLLQAWAQTRNDLPDDFFQRFTITRIRRQPLAAVLLTVQHVTRCLEMVDQPYSGGSIDKREWPSEDIFKLAELDPVNFPACKESRKLHVPGEESVLACETCESKGKTTCTRCSGYGTVVCPQCQASREAPCPQCKGEGQVVNASGTIVACQECRGRGTAGCPRCAANGRIKCVHCEGNGTLHCVTCQGHGKLKRSWQIAEEVWSECNCQQTSEESWELPLQTEDYASISSFQWSAAPHDLDGQWRDCAPSQLDRPIRQLVATACERVDVGDDGHRATGVALELRGCYAYELNVEYQGYPVPIYMAGRTAQILPQRLPKAPGMIRRWVDRLLRNFWHEVEVGVRPRIGAEYLQGVRSQQLHPWDVRGLLPRVGKDLGVTVRLNAGGYALRLPVAASTGESRDVEVIVSLDLDDQRELVLAAESRLGQAHRDRYPAMLSANRSFEFGRVAVTPVPGTGQIQMCLVDRRPYEYAEPAGYADVLASMAYEVVEILSRRWFI